MQQRHAAGALKANQRGQTLTCGSHKHAQGFPKEQKSFARISGYVEQNDIHTPQLTVRESLVYSAHLRLSSDTGEETTQRFVDEVSTCLEQSFNRHCTMHPTRHRGPLQRAKAYAGPRFASVLGTAPMTITVAEGRFWRTNVDLCLRVHS